MVKKTGARMSDNVLDWRSPRELIEVLAPVQMLPPPVEQSLIQHPDLMTPDIRNLGLSEIGDLKGGIADRRPSWTSEHGAYRYKPSRESFLRGRGPVGKDPGMFKKVKGDLTPNSMIMYDWHQGRAGDLPAEAIGYEKPRTRGEFIGEMVNQWRAEEMAAHVKNVLGALGPAVHRTAYEKEAEDRSWRRDW